MRLFGFGRRGRRVNADALNDVDPTRRGFLNLGGRRYVADAPYLLPKDLKEINRLDFQHFMLRYLLRGNYAAPLGPVKSILDVGSGTNRWGIEMANTFPDANVIGVDLIETPTETIERPANYVFVQGSVLQLPLADSSFDFVHQRLLVLALPSADWLRAVQELVRLTRPGGWVELVESTGLVEFQATPQGERGTANLRRLNEWSVQACARRQIDLSMGGKIGSVLQQTGLRRVEQHKIPIPIGGASGRVGSMMETNYLAVLSSLKQLIVAMQVTSAEEYDAAAAEAPRELALNTCVFPYYIAYGQVR